MPGLEFKITRVARSRDEAKHFYDRISKYYDTLASSTEKTYILTGLDYLDVQPGEHVLEIGFGTGHALVELARSVGQEGHVYGVDLSSGMSRQARSRLRKYQLDSRVSLVTEDAIKLPFIKEVMDAVFISFTLELFQRHKISQVISQCERVLKDNGRLCIVSLAKDQPLNFIGRVYEWLHKRFPKILDCRPIPVKAFLQQSAFHVLKHEEERMWGLPISITLAEKHPEK